MEESIYERDTVGKNTLDVISDADKFNKWMYETIKPFCKDKIFEIGSGIGNISKYFIDEQYRIQLSDLRQEYCSELDSKYKNKINYLGTVQMDLGEPDFDNKYKAHFAEYNTVFALNVIEHIFDDVTAIENCRKLLAPGGNLIILVPSYQHLYNEFDKELGHYKRYTLHSLSELFTKADFSILHKQYFNFIGIFGWYISGNILKKQSIPQGQMKLYNKLVPLFKKIDHIVNHKIGLSSIVVGKKN